MFTDPGARARRILAAVFASGLLLPGPLAAQEYFRTLATPRDLATVQPPQQEKYNISLGSGAGVNIAAGIAVEYNDNINLAPGGRRQSDLILRPSLQADAAW